MNAKGTATIKDVAQYAQVSVATVSFYLNGKPVKKENALRIQEAIDALGYRVNRIAKALRTSKSMTIGVVYNQLTSTFGLKIIDRIESWFERYGYTVFICSTRNKVENEETKVRLLIEKAVDGIIFFPTNSNQSSIGNLTRDLVPVVMIDHFSIDPDFDCILTDNVAAVYKLTEHLLENGHRDIVAMIGDDTISNAAERLDGFEKALAGYRVPVRPEMIVRSRYSEEDAYDRAMEILRRPHRPSAILSTSYDLGLGLMRALQDSHLRIPQDISVVSLDLDAFGYQQRLTTVIQPIEQIGDEASRVLLERINGERTGEPVTIRLKGTFMDNGSVNPR